MFKQRDQKPLDPLAADDVPLSPATNRTFQDVLEVRLSRRIVLGGGLGLASMVLFGTGLTGCGGSSDSTPTEPVLDLLGFSPVPVSEADTAVVPAGYSTQVLMPWGEPITGSYPPFDLNNTGEEQGMQVGMHHDGMHFFPIEGVDPFQGSSEDGLLVMNHEYIEPRLMHAAAVGKPLSAFQVPTNEDGSRDPDQVLKEIHAHGVSIARIRKNAQGRWDVAPDALNRRITGRTPMEIAGPLRGHDALKTLYSPDGSRTRGTLNNCAHGVTPWNTYLTCEENWWFYFNVDDDDVPASLSRYRVGLFTPWQWHRASNQADEFVRFDATRKGADATEDYRNEPHCFGYVVEIDPFDPDSTPVKRTHLGRFSHEGVIFAPAVEGKPVVLYSGDDSAFEYIYKFVSRQPYARATASGALLDEGTLYVARFNDDGTGVWLALVPGENGLGEPNGFGEITDILLNTRGAADIAGATRMDRPEWGAIDPVTGAVYFTLTNNPARTEEQTDGPNPRANNLFGQIVRWRESGGDPTATTFEWELFVLAGPQDDSRDLNGAPLTEDSIFAMPDGLWFDADRRLWIQTDIGDSSQNTGPYAPVGNNAMLAANPETGEIRRFLTGPVGQEVTGCITTPDQKTLFINFQHPGSVTSPEDFAAGKLAGNWPDGGNAYPRSATLVITKDDGGKIGT